ncbi:MAG: sulfotransferase, partial [Verrucomicrobiota bacterium]
CWVTGAPEPSSEVVKNVFIVGEQRSGSNLLRLMLNQSDELACPHPPHFLERLHPLLNRYGDLQQEGNFQELADDLVELIRRNPVRWEGFDLEGADLAARCSKRSLFALKGAAMDRYAELRGAEEGWVCKSMQNVRWFQEIEGSFERPLYVHLYRDPRDVCASFLKAVVGSKHPYLISRKWTELQELCLDLKEKAPDRYWGVSYEWLIERPEKELRALCGFLGIRFTDSMLEFHRSDEAVQASRTSSLWKNVSRPLMTRNFRKFDKALDRDALGYVEKVAGDVMKKLGYRPVLDPSELESIEVGDADLAAMRKEDEQGRIRIEESMNAKDKETRAFQSDLIEEIASRPSRLEGPELLLA